jgi:ketosteroid isomerase-like protein
MELAEKIAEQKQAMQVWFDGFTSGDIEYAFSRFADDATWLGVGKDFVRHEYQGKQAIIDYQSTWVKKVWDGRCVYFPTHIVGDGEVVIAEWEDEAVARATGERYRNRGVCVFEFDGGTTVVRARAYFDFTPLVGGHIVRLAEEGTGVVAGT